MYQYDWAEYVALVIEDDVFVWGVVCECTEMGLRHLVRGETRARCQTGDNLKFVIMLQKECVMT